MAADIKISAKLLKASHLAFVEMSKLLKTDSLIEEAKYRKIENYDVTIYVKKNSYEFLFSRHGWNGFGGGVIFIFSNKTVVLEDTVRTK
ncbi:hypothetical protein ACO0LM_24965 [Undibacterium sp. Di26W]|uniref:hypothetical protein n=1 Tax=Undibacterium sp. Di26W TaxID=3413035 RepID=UPI003BF332A7